MSPASSSAGCHEETEEIVPEVTELEASLARLEGELSLAQEAGARWEAAAVKLRFDAEQQRESWQEKLQQSQQETERANQALRHANASCSDRIAEAGLASRLPQVDTRLTAEIGAEIEAKAALEAAQLDLASRLAAEGEAKATLEVEVIELQSKAKAFREELQAANEEILRHHSPRSSPRSSPRASRQNSPDLGPMKSLITAVEPLARSREEEEAMALVTEALERETDQQRIRSFSQEAAPLAADDSSRLAEEASCRLSADLAASEAAWGIWEESQLAHGRAEDCTYRPSTQPQPHCSALC